MAATAAAADGGKPASLSGRLGDHVAHRHDGFSEESYQRSLAYRPDASDVFITTAPKTGTTWMQVVCHFLRTGGKHDDFEDLYQVSPWDQMAWDLDMDLAAEPVARPRLFKTHLPLSTVARGGKYLCVVRDVERTILSWWRFLKEKDVPPLRKYSSASEFAHDRDFVLDGMRFGAHIWQYYREFFQCLDLPNVLVLVFEDLEADLDGHLDLIADFIGAPRPEGEARQRILWLSGKEGMASMSTKYDESWAYEQLKRVGRSPDLDSWVPATRVHLSKVKEELDDAARAALAGRWEKDLAALGLADYPALQRAVREEVARRRSGEAA